MDAEDWSFRAEGSKNLTIANRKKGCILRILKEAKTSPVNLCGGEYRNTHTEYQRVFGYHKNVMSTVCGSYMGEMELTSVEEDFLTEVGERLEPNRNAKRRDKKKISLSAVAIMMPDYAFIPNAVHIPYKSDRSLSKSTYCFGLKVKHLQNLSKVNSISPCQQYPQCATCIDRYLERKKQSLGEHPVSKFCPCQLSSGDPEAATSAIRQLLTGFNSFKNRLDFCKNGVQKELDLYDDVWGLLSEIDEYRPRIKQGKGQECLIELSEILYTAFYHTRKNPMELNGKWKASPQYITDCFTQIGSVPKGSVLDVIANAQDLAADIGTIERAYIQLTEAMEKQPEIADKLYLHGPYDNEMWCLTKQPGAPHGVEQTVMNAFLVVRNYLIYRTVSSCSVLIALQYLPRTSETPLPDSTSSSFVIHFKGNDILCNVVMIDFDPKPFKSIQPYINRGKQILNFAQETDQRSG